jgi:mannose-6-phosphate isomerase-like protein (cupin superfamily)
VAEAINFSAACAELAEYWSPKVVGHVNNHFIKVAKLRGELAWHKHDNEDEFFQIIKGHLTIQFEDDSVRLGPGDFYVVPRNVMHNPRAEEECWIVLIETVTTKHTGDVVTPLTRTIAEQLR